MKREFLDTLVGPFGMDVTPEHEGFYAVQTDGAAEDYEIWAFISGQWVDSDDGLGIEQDPSRAKGWYGHFTKDGETDDGTQVLVHATGGAA